MQAKHSVSREAPPDPNRPALAAGDPAAWGALLAGTLLEGLPWPGFGTQGWDSLILRRANDNEPGDHTRGDTPGGGESGIDQRGDGT